jgi:hypothetical protein
MAYTKTTWAERKGSGFNLYAKSAETPTSVILTNTPTITQPGTPFNVEDMNKIEEGIFAAHQAIDNHVAASPIGYPIGFLAMPSGAQLSDWRCLPLDGRLIQISLYQSLCDMMYCGNANNATADWWYKTSDANGTVRDPSGAYMRVLDHRGLFSRAAGQNGKYKMANDAPYDGKAIGAFIPDAMQYMNGYLTFVNSEATDRISIIGAAQGVFSRGAVEQRPNKISASILSSGVGETGSTLAFSNEGYRSSEETRSASISAYLCIKY